MSGLRRAKGGALFYFTIICFTSQAPCILMVEEVDATNLYISVSYPNLNFNISDPLTIGSRVTGQERFYSISKGVDVQVRIMDACQTLRV